MVLLLASTLSASLSVKAANDIVSVDTLRPERNVPLVHDTLPSAEVRALRHLPATESAHPVQSITERDMQMRGITSTADAIRRFAGVNVRDYGGAGGLKTVSVRGLGASHTGVVYDGLTQSDAQAGQVDISRYALERMGAITLRTIDSEDLLCPVRELAAATLVFHTFMPDGTSQGLHGRAALRQGSWQAWSPSLLLALGTKHGTALNVSADYAHGRNNYPFTLPNGVATHTERRVNTQTNDLTLEANLRQRLRGGHVSAKAFYADSHHYLPGPVTYYVNEGTEHLTERHAFLQGRWEQRWGAWQIFAATKADYQQSRYIDRDAQYPGGALRQNYRQREAYAATGAACTLGSFQAALATDYAYNDLRSNLKTDNDVWRHTSLTALTLRYTLASLTLTARLQGALYRNHAASGAKAATDAHRLSPTVALIWKAVGTEHVQWNVRTSYKETFRAPTFTENYYYHLGSTTLRPECTRQWNAGTTLRLLPNEDLELTATADAYINRVWDKISSIPYNLFVWRTVNLGRVRTMGADFTLDAAWHVAQRHHLFLNASYTLCSARNRTDKTEDSYNKQLAYTPIHSGAASLAWENPWVNLSLSLTAAGRRWATNAHTSTTDMAGYYELGMTLYRTLRIGTTHLDLRADLINLTDQNYSVVRRYPMPGRNYKLSVVLRF